MTKEQQFIKDLHYNDVQVIPFVELFHNNEYLRNELFQQYLKTEKEPDLSLFISSHYTDEEIKKGFVEAQDKLTAYESGSVTNKLAASFVFQTDFEASLQDLTNEFYSLSVKKKVPAKYYKHSIRRTELFKQLQEIATTITDFHLFVQNNKDYDAKNEAEIIATDIISRLEAIGLRNLTELVLTNFVEQQKTNYKRLEILNGHTSEADKAKTKYRHLVRYANRVVNDYLKSLSTNLSIGVIPNQQAENTAAQKSRIKEEELKELSLEDYFESIAKYKKLMEILASENLVQPNTYIWKDQIKGNKSFLAALIKHLHLQGFFKNGIRATDKEIVEITKNTFQWPVSIDTVKRAKPDNFDLRFIPPASTIS